MIRTIALLALAFLLGSLAHAFAVEHATRNHRTVYRVTPEKTK